MPTKQPKQVVTEAIKDPCWSCRTTKETFFKYSPRLPALLIVLIQYLEIGVIV